MPLEDLRRFGYAEEELGQGMVDERPMELMRFEISRARTLYQVADEGMRYIPRGRRYPVVVARRLYEAALGRIEAQNYDVFEAGGDLFAPQAPGNGGVRARGPQGDRGAGPRRRP